MVVSAVSKLSKAVSEEKQESIISSLADRFNSLFGEKKELPSLEEMLTDFFIENYNLNTIISEFPEFILAFGQLYLDMSLSSLNEVVKHIVDSGLIGKAEAAFYAVYRDELKNKLDEAPITIKAKF